METLIIVQNIFFILASVVLVVLGIVFTVVLIYILAIVKDARKVTHDIKLLYTKARNTISKIIGSEQTKK